VDDTYDWATNKSTDYHPLVNPVSDFEVPNLSSPPPSAAPTPTQHPTVNTGAQPPKIEPYLTAVVIASVLSVAAVATALIYFKRKRKPSVT
jgi:hypothetical protein